MSAAAWVVTRVMCSAVTTNVANLNLFFPSQYFRIIVKTVKELMVGRQIFPYHLQLPDLGCKTLGGHQMGAKC